MVKKITVYTAFGQFIEMVERQAELEKQLNTDCYPVDHPLSDYQNALNSVHEIQSCPVGSSVSIGQLPKKSSSCPGLSFDCDPIPKTISPVPTTIETRKLNEATELMMSFWKVHVTSRKTKEESADSKKSILEKDDLPSIFEKVSGLFANPSTTSVFSLFGKFEDLFEEMVEVVKERAPNTEELTWTSPDQPHFPQLPVFVKSPVDSLKIYMGSEQNTDEMADDEMSPTTSSLTASSSSATSSATSSTQSVSSNTCSASTDSSSTTCAYHLRKKCHLQQAVMDEQKKIIDCFYNLQKLNQQLEYYRHC